MKKIINYIYLFLFFFSLFHISIIIIDNYNYFKISFNKISYIYFSILFVLSTIVNYYGNNINYNISVNFFRNLSYAKFSQVNIISNLINEVIPILGMMYKGYILKKFKLSYTNYFISIFLWRILNLSFFFIFIIFFLLYFERSFYIKLILISLIILFFIIFKYFKFKETFFIKYKFLRKVQIFFYTFKINFKKIISNVVLLHFFNFLLFYSIITIFFSINLEFIIIIYFLRSIIAFVPLLNVAAITIPVVSYVSSFLLKDLSFLENILINFIHSIILTLGSLLLLFLIFTYKKLKIKSSL